MSTFTTTAPLAKILKTIIGAAGRDSTLPVLQTVHAARVGDDTLRLTTTDRFLLARIDVRGFFRRRAFRQTGQFGHRTEVHRHAFGSQRRGEASAVGLKLAIAQRAVEDEKVGRHQLARANTQTAASDMSGR